MAELHIPAAAVARLLVCDQDAHLHDRADTCVRAIAAPVVAAELRRLAKVVEGHDWRCSAAVRDIGLALRNHADEIEREAR